MLIHHPPFKETCVREPLVSSPQPPPPAASVVCREQGCLLRHVFSLLLQTIRLPFRRLFKSSCHNENVLALGGTGGWGVCLLFSVLSYLIGSGLLPQQGNHAQGCETSQCHDRSPAEKGTITARQQQAFHWNAQG